MFTKVTEQTSLHENLDQKSVLELMTEMNEEDQKVALAVKAAIPQITALVEQIVPRMQQGGRIFYMVRVRVAAWAYSMPARFPLRLVCRLLW